MALTIRHWGFIIYLGISGLIPSCDQTGTTPDKDPVLAQVYNKALVLSDLKEIVNPAVSAKDSVQLIQSFVDRWVREAILMHEAEKHVRQDMDIDQLVRDYRSSLILSNFERDLFESELDTNITNEDINAYYSAKKDQFRLRYDIVRYSLVKVPSNSQEVDFVRQWWKTRDDALLATVKSKLKANGAFYDLQENKWWALADLKKKIPNAWQNGLSASTDIINNKNNYLYLLKIHDLVKKGSVPPLSYVRDQVEKIILHSRKMKLIEDKKSTLYEEEMKSANVQIFTN